MPDLIELKTIAEVKEHLAKGVVCRADIEYPPHLGFNINPLKVTAACDFAIVTDGLENASKEFTRDQVKQMIQHQEEHYNWQFTYLGANQDAFSEAAHIGIKRDSAVNIDVKNFRSYAGVSGKMSQMRTSVSRGEAVSMSYTDKERSEMA